MFQGCLKGVSREFQRCFISVSSILQGCFMRVSWMFLGLISFMSDWTEFQACFKKVSEICHDCLKTALRVFHVFFSVFYGNFKYFKTR